jgi:hypothetical protein
MEDNEKNINTKKIEDFIIEEELNQSNNDKLIIDFLKETITKFENNTLTENERFEITEFYLKYNYKYINTDDDIEEDNMKKYLTLGWYIYKLLGKN